MNTLLKITFIFFLVFTMYKTIETKETNLNSLSENVKNKNIINKSQVIQIRNTQTTSTSTQSTNTSTTTQTNTQTQPTSSTQTQSTSGTQTQPTSSTQTQSTSGTQTQPTSSTQTQSTSGTQTQPISSTQTGTQSQSTSGTQTGTQSGTQSQATSGTQTGTQSKPTSGTQTNTQTQNSGTQTGSFNDTKNTQTGSNSSGTQQVDTQGTQQTQTTPKAVTISSIPGYQGTQLSGSQINTSQISSLNTAIIENYNTNNLNINTSNSISKEISSLTQSYTTAVSQGLNQPDNTIFNLASTNISLNKNSMSNNQGGSGNNNQGSSSSNSNTISLLKQEIAQLGGSFIAYDNTKNQQITSVSYKTDNFNIQIFDSTYYKQNLEYSKSNNLTVVDTSECLAKIRKYLNVTDDYAIPMQKIDWDSTLVSTSGTGLGSVTFNYYNPFTSELLDSQTICNNSTITVKIPVNTTELKLNVTLYDLYRNKSVNIYNKDDAFYTSRCLTFVNSSSDGDVTLDSRRNDLFPNISVACSDGCEFEGIDIASSYIICNCVPTNNTEAELSTTGFVDSISSSNLDIVICLAQAFNPTVLYSNPGFWCNGSFLLIGLSVIVLFKFLGINTLKKNFTTILRNDATFFSKNIVDFNKIINNAGENFEMNEINNGENIKINAETGGEIHYIQDGDPPANPNEVKCNIPVPNPPPSGKEELIWVNPSDERANLTNNLNVSGLENAEKIILNENINQTINYKKNDHDKNNFIVENEIKQINNSIMNNNSKYSRIVNNVKEIKNNNNYENIAFRAEILEQITNNFTLRDYMNMPYEELIKYDKRSFLRYYFDRLLNKHTFFIAFFLKTVVKPQSIRIIAFFLVVSFSFALNAIFYSDKYIQEKTQSFNKETDTTFGYTVSKQFWKSVWSILIGTVPILLLNLLVVPPSKYYLKLNKAFMSVDLDKVNLAYLKYYNKMMWRYYLYVFLAIILHMFSWYYVTAFCSVYVKSSVSWVCGGILSIIINLIVVQFSLPMIHTIFRTLAKKYPDNKFIRICYKICLKIF